MSYAAENGHKVVFELLLHQPDVEVNLRDNKGRTPFFHAANRGRESIIRLLINTTGVDIISQDSIGQTALSYAVLHGHEGVVRQLLTSGEVNIYSRDTIHGQTPLLLALKYKYKSITKLLLDRPNIDINVCGNRGQTLCDYARDQGMYEEAEAMAQRALEARE